MMFLPGELSCQTTFPVFLLTAIKLGASGDGILASPSRLSTPLLVQAKTKSPATNGEQFDILCGKTLSSFIMSIRQLILASFFSPSTSAHTTSHALLT